MMFTTTESHLNRLPKVCEDHLIVKYYRFASRTCEIIAPHQTSSTLCGKLLSAVSIFVILGARTGSLELTKQFRPSSDEILLQEASLIAQKDMSVTDYYFHISQVYARMSSDIPEGEKRR